MVLHTIIAEYDIMQAQNVMEMPKMQAIQGGLVEYSLTPQGKQISKLFSTDPYLYLSDKYKPYSKLL